MNVKSLQFLLLAPAALAFGGEPVNLAARATASASSTFSADYEARFAIDGQVAEADSRDDLRRSWCVVGAQAAGQGEFTLSWPEPVPVAEIVYYGRTAWMLTECWKDFQVFLNDSATPAATGQLRMAHGPQRIALPAPTPARRVTLKFSSSYGGLNPGAAEIAVYGQRLTDAQLADFPPSPLRARLMAGELGFRDLLVIKRHHLKTSHVYTYHVDGFLPGGGLYVFTPATGKLRELVSAGAGEIIDCDLSYDGKEVLFSWKQGGAPIPDVASSGCEHSLAVPGENYQVFRINLDGTGLTRLTDDGSNSLNARWLPDGGIAFTSDRRPAFAYCWVSSSPVLHRMERDGSKVRRLSSSYLMDFTPVVLNDGRILYTRWEYVDRPAIPIQGLWTIRPDGTGLSGFFGNRVLSPATFMQAQPIPNAGTVLCLLTTHNGDPRGAIGLIDPSHGGNAQSGIRNLTPEVNIGRVDEGNGNHFANAGAYETPYPIDGRHYLVSKAGAIQLRDYDNAQPPATVLPKPTDGLGFYSPVPVQTRPRPPVLPSLPPSADSGPWATVFMSDVYNGLEPSVKRGEVKQVAVVEEIAKTAFAPVQSRAFGFQFPIVSCGATYAPKKIWGYADVAEDGSAHFKVPSGLPVYFLALDAEGRAVQRMRTFTHFMPGEVQSCVGCHADRNYAAPPSPAAARSAGPAQPLRPPEWGAKAFSYREVVQPVLDRHCVACHHARDPQGGVDLGGDLTDFFNVSYEFLARQGTWGERNFMAGGIPASQAGRNPYTSWIPTINGTEHSILQVAPRTWGSPASRLAELVLNGHPGADGKARVQVPAADRRRIMAWIDLDVPYYPTSSSTDLKATGCRRILPAGLDAALNQVAATRCVSCHEKGVPRDFYVRIEKPELNRFLLAPLAKAAGGTERCGKPVFATTGDPDYRALLKTFEPVAAKLKQSPRDDMSEAQPGGVACCSSR